jgi:hypothetical protein
VVLVGGSWVLRLPFKIARSRGWCLAHCA